MFRHKAKCVILICLSVFCLNACGGVSPAADREAAFDILDAWTCVRWGEDNIAWMVHYPEELIEPWVRSEAEKQRMRPEQMEEFRKSFSDELRIGSASAFLLSVHGYGASPVDLSPMGDNIVLIDSSGRRVRPIVFERKLDDPIYGLVQGFVFFPLQEDKNFSIAVKGLVPNKETSFAFSGTVRRENDIAVAIATAPDMITIPDTVTSPPPENTSQREVVVRIPTRRVDTPDTPSLPTQPEPTAVDMSEFDDFNDFGDFGDTAELFAPTEPVMPPASQFFEELPDEPKDDTLGLTPRQVLEIYLRAWIDVDAERMYSLLSTESQYNISRELFNREVMSSGFRGGLRSGYKINWVGDSARVTVAKKILFIRTLETRQINFVTEDGSARVSW